MVHDSDKHTLVYKVHIWAAVISPIQTFTHQGYQQAVEKLQTFIENGVWAVHT